MKGLEKLKNDLYENSNNGNGISSWHCILELICAVPFLERNYTVQAEQALGKDNLICDLYATKNNHKTIIEIETGFTIDGDDNGTRNHILDCDDYLRSRIAAKIVRYSPHADVFCLATRKVYNMEISELFLEDMTQNGVSEIRELCAPYYKVDDRDIWRSHLDYIMTIDLDKTNIKMTTPEKYIEWVNDMDDIISGPSEYFI